MGWTACLRVQVDFPAELARDLLLTVSLEHACKAYYVPSHRYYVIDFVPDEYGRHQRSLIIHEEYHEIYLATQAASMKVVETHNFRSLEEKVDAAIVELMAFLDDRDLLEDLDEICPFDYPDVSFSDQENMFLNEPEEEISYSRLKEFLESKLGGEF